MTYSSFGAYGRKLKLRGVRVSFAMAKMADAVGKDVLTEAKAKMSGNIKTVTLKKAGHPFGHKRGRKWSQNRRVRLSAGGAFPKLPINEQTGKLKRNTRLHRTRFGGKVSSNADYAKFILAEDGTRRMVARGYNQHMRRATKTINGGIICTFEWIL